MIRIAAIIVAIISVLSAGWFFFMQGRLVENTTQVSQTAPVINKYILRLQLKDGDVEIALRPDLAPTHVVQIKALVAAKFYDGIVFHRVIDGFMAQTGDPTGTGTGGSELSNLKAEFSQASFKRGILGMARSGHPDSANSQFFIMLADGPHLNGQYTIFGEVTKGMEFVDKIKRGKGSGGMVDAPDKIIKLELVE